MNIKNPLPIKNIGDPYVLRVNETYYLYATSDFDGFYCWQSKDLSHWSNPVICYESTGKSFGNCCFWAPEVYEFDHKFYMYYTAQWKKYEQEELRIGVAVSDYPEGPFEEVYDQKPMFDFNYGVLDAHLLKDDKANYLYYSRAGANHYVDGIQQSEIYVVKLGDDYCSVVGEAKKLLVPEQEWEKAEPDLKQRWNEGAFVVKHQDKYHMMYSANHYQSGFYGIGAAVADQPMGPFKKYANNPILKTNGKISGPGHNSVVATPEGELYCVYHAHTDYQKKGGDRQVYLSRLFFDQGKLVVEYPECN